ncbi:hypothetical protein ACFOY2_45600 [Nonomuraea purpurea]|uniref:Uncharacterized protein n=1 Tax=Nonomuraea purpurea TaxID=1849276 RepID=A0ABV8GKT7_9ACTN
MYSYYVLHRSLMTNNNGDTYSRIHVLSDPDDLRRAINALAWELGYPWHEDVCWLRVYQRGALTSVVDLVAESNPGPNLTDEEFGALFDDPARVIDIPQLLDPVLPPGHSVRIADKTYAYGCTSHYP